MSSAGDDRHGHHGWPFVGRSRELTTFSNALRMGQRAMIVFGEPGVGKSRLLREATHLPETVRMGVDVLRRRIPRPGWEIWRPSDAEAGHTSRHRLLLVDDAHLLDEEAAALAHHQAETASAFVLLTVPSGQQVSPHITALWKDGLGPRVDLGGLQVEDVNALLCRVLDGRVEEHTVHDLCRITRGNPQYLRELVGHGVESGLLGRVDGVLAWRGEMLPGSRLEDLVLARLGALAEEERRVLQLVAVGEQLPVSCLERMAVGAGPLERLERDGHLIVRTTASRTVVELSHPLHAHVLRSGSPLGVRAAARQLADTIEQSEIVSPEDELLAARYRLLAGEAPDPKVAARAGRRAVLLAQLEAAEELARIAIDGGLLFEGSFVLADVLILQRRHAEAEDLLGLLCQKGGEDDELSRAVVRRAVNVFWGMRRPHEAIVMLDQAERGLGQAESRARLSAARASLALVVGEAVNPLPRERSERGDGSPDDVLHRRLALQALVAAVPAWLANGDMAPARAGIAEGLELARHHGEEFPLAEERLRLCEWFHMCLDGRLGAAAAFSESQHRRVMGLRDRSAALLWVAACVRAYILMGRMMTARERLRDSWPGLPHHDQFGMSTVLLTERAYVNLSTGQSSDAAADLARIDHGAPSAGIWLGSCVELAQAWLSSARGQHEEATRTLGTRAARARDLGQFAIEALVLSELARLSAADEVAARLSELGSRTGSRLIRALAAHALALAHRNGAELDDATIQLEEIGAHLLAAEASSAAASAHADTEARVRARIRAYRLAARCERVTTPILRASRPSERLSAREREVAVLAAQGLPSRTIAERLVLSRRTVDNHLYRVYRKLDVPGRESLSDLQLALGGKRDGGDETGDEL